MVPQLLQRLDALLHQKWSSFYEMLLPGLSSEQIQRVESALGVELPQEFKLFYQWKNGHSNSEYKNLWYNRNLLNVEQILETWTVMNELLELGEFEEPNWWNPRWIPFAENGAGDHYVLDLAGSFGGQPGQVIEFWHNDPDRHIYFDSFSKWLETIVLAIERGYQNHSGNYRREDAEAFKLVEEDDRIFEQAYADINPGFPLIHTADEED